MHTDADFLKQLGADPSDDTTRLVYADWLDEQGDSESAAKAQFLRLTAELARTKGRRNRKKRKKRMQQLAAGLDTDWLAVVSRLAVELCAAKRKEAERGWELVVEFRYLCDRRWEDLRPTDDNAVRSCDSCGENVHYCDTITQAREHAWAGHCIAVDLGVIRRKNDLEPQHLYLGMPSLEMLREQEERMQPDEVSAERERRKREKEGRVVLLCDFEIAIGCGPV